MNSNERYKIIKVAVELAEDGYIAYPLGMKGAIVGQGDSCELALDDVRSAIKTHIKEFWFDSHYVVRATMPDGKIVDYLPLPDLHSKDGSV
jgi:hypothetical protein